MFSRLTAAIRSLASGGAVLAVLALATTPISAASAASGARPGNLAPFIPIQREYLPLPADMQPWYPTFIRGGRAILFENLTDRALWTINTDGTGLHCISCGFADAPAVGGGFAFAFADGKRVLLTHGVSGAVDSGPRSDAWILECASSLQDCSTHRYLPVDMSADRGPFPLFQRRTWHLAPDGKHIGWMEVRADGTLMVVARLERRADRYVAIDPRVVNPEGPRSATDDNADRWENFSQLYELKSFTPDGRGILAVGTPNNNVDVMRIELATGKVTRLTANPDWDEDSSLSPDQQLFLVHGWRGRHRLEPLAWIPQIRGFVGLGIGAAIAPYYVSTPAGFQCDISPWLLPSSGDRGGRLIGQPVDVYDGNLTAAAHQLGQQTWSPDSRMVLIQERTRNLVNLRPPNRIAIAKLDRAPTSPLPFADSDVGAWAPAAKDYRGPLAEDRTVLVRGNSGGQARITYKGKLGTASSISVTFERFTDDGATFVNGSMAVASEARGTGENRPWHLLADVRVTGQHSGYLNMDSYIDNSTRPLPSKTGTISATYDGKVAASLPPIAPCYDELPKPFPLQAVLEHRGKVAVITVSANILGDVRPVMNATVRYGARSAKTNASGRAQLPWTLVREGAVTVTAGNNFIRAVAREKGQ